MLLRKLDFWSNLFNTTEFSINIKPGSMLYLTFRFCNCKLANPPKRNCILGDLGEFSISGIENMVPLMNTYCYKSLINSLEDMLQRPGFEDKCEQWCSRETVDGVYSDVYDGRVWQQFQNYNGQSFLSSPNNYAFMVNVDWFQPFKRVNSVSVGVIYLVCMNLPRELRFLRENVILAGIIPALDREPSSLNTFLQPLVNDLKLLWGGVPMTTHKYESGTTARGALLCAAADIPACRKLCGFMGHSARLGCSKCRKEFKGGFGEKKDYSGFNVPEWPKRTHSQHLEHVNIVRNTNSKTARANAERTFGVRWSPLLELSYFNIIDFHVVDPMHNLFLGTAKKMFDISVSDGLLDNRKLHIIQCFCSK